MKTKTKTNIESNIKKKSEKAVDFFKTIAIYLLTASMLVSAGLYINARQNAGQSAEIPWEKLRIIESGGAVVEKINENHINPVQITVTAGNNSFTAIYDNSLILDIYKDFKQSVRDIFGVKSKCQRLDKEEGDELWIKCAEKENSVYIKYAGNYIYPVIYAFLDKEWDTDNSAEAFSGFSEKDRELSMVHELFIVNEPSFCAAAKDTDGNVSVFVPESGIANIIKSKINAENLSEYNNIEGVIPCEFLKNDEINAKTGINGNNIRNLQLPADFHLFYKYVTYSSVLKFSNPVLDENNKINADQNFIRELFKVLNFNIENAGSHFINGGTAFRDGKNTVNFYNSGRIIYTGGIHLSKFLGYDSDYYTSYEKIKAASVFVSSLDANLTGNDCGIYLKKITSDPEENIEMFFSYYYGGIKIRTDGSDEGIAVRINSDSITEVKIESLSISSPEMIKNINPVLILNGIDDLISQDMDMYNNPEETAQKYKLRYDKNRDKFIVNGFELIYNYDTDYTESDNSPVKAAWEIK